MALPLGSIAYAIATESAYHPRGCYSQPVPERHKQKKKGNPQKVAFTYPRKSPNSLRKPTRAFKFGKKRHSPPASPSPGPCTQDLRFCTGGFHQDQRSSFESQNSLVDLSDILSSRVCSKPKHVPIIIPHYASITGYSSHSTTKIDFCSIEPSSDAAQHKLTSATGLVAKRGREPPPIATGFSLYAVVDENPRHVEIKIPAWAQPLLKEAVTPPRISLRKSAFVDFFADTSTLNPFNMSRPSADASRANTMDSNTSAPSPTQLYANRSNSGSNAYLSSVNSSQSSLVGLRQDYESASESESTNNEPTPHSHSMSHSIQSPADGGQTPAATPSTAQQLSGLVCNVHRTTGREPHPVVGATTTILGDKLYVFGGRRLSRSKAQLTSNLYELDLLRRHWTKIEALGDVPPPRYFHSVCALGDTKLVCYGGMSPANPQEPGSEAQSEVVVLSDLHIYDVRTRTWTKISTADSPQGRYAHCAAILPSSAVFASAAAPTSALQHNRQGESANSGSLGITIDGTGGAEMVVVGGQDSSNHYIEEISVFNTRSLKWTTTAAMGRSCGAYRSVVTPLTTMSTAQVGAGPHARSDIEEDDEEPSTPGSGSPLLIYSNYNFLDVKLELQIRGMDGNLTEKPMQTAVSPPGLRFPNGGVIDNHFVVSGTFLTSSKQEYALWALDLKTLSWSRIDAGGSIFSQGSWNRGVLWQRRNSFVILGNRKRNLVDDYNNRRINFTNVCIVELEAFGLYDNPRRVSPMSGFLSASSSAQHGKSDFAAAGRDIGQPAESLGSQSLVRELADMDFLCIDGSRIPVNSRVAARRWGPYFTKLLRETVSSGTETDTMTLRPSAAGHPSRNSSITITQATEGGPLTTHSGAGSEVPDVRTAPPSSRSRLLYIPHTAPTIHALVYYLYTSSLPTGTHPLATVQIFCSLLQLARPYKVDGLLEAIVERLHECLDGRNAAAIFNAAAMGSGGGDGVQFTNGQSGLRESVIPLRTASLSNTDGNGVAVNGASRSGPGSLRIDTDMANGRSTRNTLRPGQVLHAAGDETDDDIPQSATTDTSMSESEASLSSVTGRSRREREVWSGATSAVVGLQKRGLRGLMEGRRMRERGRDGESVGRRVGLGIV